MNSVEEFINHIKISDDVLSHLSQTEIEFNEYLNLLLSTNQEFRENFLETIKNQEILNTNVFEGENAFITSFVINKDNKRTAIDGLIEILKDKNSILSEHQLKSIHYSLLNGISSIQKMPGKNRDHQVWIGEPGSSPENGAIFVPPETEKVPELMNQFLDYFNRPMENEPINHPFIKSAIIHVILATIHPFVDGNGRIARLLHFCKMWQLYNYKYTKELELPTLYLSTIILEYRLQYFRLLNTIQKDSSEENWNKWFEFILNRMDDQIYYLSNNLTETYENYQDWNNMQTK